LLECPECDRETGALKEFHFVDEYFSIVLYHKWTMTDCLACPRCMQLHLLKRLGVTIFTANIAWPFFLLPHYSYLLALTFVPRHSKSIQKEFREAYQLALNRKKWAEEDHLAEIQRGKVDRR
jgi:hypothetical protein